MLLRHTAQYVVARGLPGLVNFAALAVYTRLLDPEAYGQYALVLVAIGFANVAVFQWHRLVLQRFYAAHEDAPRRFLGGVLAQFLVLALAVTGIGALLALWWPDPVGQRLVALAVPLLLAQAWLELNLALVRARLEPSAYGRLLGSKAVIALGVGALLAWAGLGAAAPLVGLLAGHVIAFVVFGLSLWRGIAPRLPEAAVLREHLRYGLPLTVTFALAWVVSGSDRVLIAHFLDEQAVGVYAAGYDLAFQSLTLVLTTINTAAYPLAVTALERSGEAAAREQLRQNGEWILAAALAGAAGLIVLAPALVAVLIGEAFREGALVVLPWVAAAAALAGIKAYHFDIAYHLGRASQYLVATGAVAAIANVALNLWLIPAHGILGAAWATLGAYGLALLLSAAVGQRAFPMPSTASLLIKAGGVGAAAALAAWLGLALGDSPTARLSIGLASGLIGGGVIALAADIGGVRRPIARFSRCYLRTVR